MATIHLIMLPLLFVAASALYFYSESLPPDTPTPDPSHIASTPSSEPSVGQSVEATPSANPSKQPTGTPTAKPSAKPTPEPTASPEPSPSPANNLLAFGIAATTSEQVYAEAKLHIGRVDPFKSITPPNLPAFEPAISPEQLSVNLQPQKGSGNVVTVYSTPAPTAVKEAKITDGLVLKAIINGGLDPVAIVDIDGTSELVRVGDRLSGDILVTSIYYEERYILLSRGKQSARLDMEEEDEDE